VDSASTEGEAENYPKHRYEVQWGKRSRAVTSRRSRRRWRVLASMQMTAEFLNNFAQVVRILFNRSPCLFHARWFWL
jgi:hypothetical protein